MEPSLKLDYRRVDRKRRNQKPRVLLSCTTCREMKLRCNRAFPCDNCQKRGLEAGCHYNTERALPEQRHHLHSECERKIQELQSQLLRLKSESQAERCSRSAINSPDLNPIETIQTAEPTYKSTTDSQILVPESESTYSINGNHWQAMMRNATENLLNSDNSNSYETGCTQVPQLLQGVSKETTLEDLLMGLPARNIVDALVSRCLDTAEPSLMIVHAPTFKRECVEFWNNPSGVSRAWLALLFGILSCSVWMDHSMDPEMHRKPHPKVFTHYRQKCIAALISSNYTTPGRYKLEAATIHLGVEYLQSDGLKTDISILMSIVSRLALMMGYHRDPSIYVQLSHFEKEMRRRVWLILSLIDYFVSWQSGLPTVFPVGLSNVAPPETFIREDSDRNTEDFLLSNPDRMISVNITFALAQVRLMRAANAIIESIDADSMSTSTFHLEQQLDTAWAHVPAYLKGSATSRSDCHTGLQVLTLEMTYHRARCILYRRHLLKERRNPKYKLFRTECVHAAQRVLHCQTELFQGIFSQPQFRHKVWFGISRSICDCLTAAMVISLEIINRTKNNEFIGHGSLEELVETLRISHLSWEQCSRPSPETIKAAGILKKMLSLIDQSDSVLHRPQIDSSLIIHEHHNRLV
ncbi:hypothetical protein PENSTE_c025G02481 [Penicillium steckii]|uniref:Zn(2)-C6 fungal-type domain-containing protein n=1 Tax=Penicillium steckii TaxID=303698 RepID=A0A1V6SQ82_9EURO|nr:hypothetical protein PENSTE_c025G02481 [Penicillium steckii]